MSHSTIGTKLDTVIIFTERMDELAQFYTTVLGIGPYQANPGHLGCQLDQVYFGFDQVEGVAGSKSSGITLWFRVDDLQKTFDLAIENGATVRYPPTEKPWGDTLACVNDPDGNILGLAQK